MPPRFVEVQPAVTVAFDDIVASVGNVGGVDVANAGAAAAFAAAKLLQRPPDVALYLFATAVVLHVVHAVAVLVGTRRFLEKSKLE
jgi:uncharacterized membrane protein YgdD (TMEM256/DUF423 family)